MVTVSDSPIFRLACLAGALFLVANLFLLGAKPVAVGLFPAPLDKVAHFATFGLIAALLWFPFQRKHPFLIVAIVGAIGAADEFHQHFLPGRSASFEDWLVDIAAALIIISLMSYAKKRNPK